MRVDCARAPRMGNWLRAMALAVVALALSSCYVPDRFHAELRLSRYGDYLLTFEGDLVYLPIQYDYANGRVPPDQDARRQKEIHDDLARDTAFSQVVSLGHGRFHVSYSGPVKYAGVHGARLGRDELIAILRRDARLLAIKSNPDNRIVIAANSLKPSDAEMMAKQGIGMRGEFRVTTDANVIENNASEIRQFGTYKVYIWNIENPLSPMPHMVVIRDVDPTRPLP